MSVKLCKNAWISADKYQFIINRLIGKTEKAYQADIKRAKKRGKAPDSVKRYTCQETYPATIERALDVAFEYSLRDSKLLQEDQSIDSSTNEGKRPVGAKKIESLKALVLSTKKDIITTFKNTMEGFTKESLIIREENAKMKDQIKKLKLKLQGKGIDEDS